MIGSFIRTVIVQPTTLCNMDCAYCYLPQRKQGRLMPPLVTRAVAASIAKDNSSLVDVVWHCGEPLATPIGHMRELLASFDSVQVRHSTQTNATLVDDRWCELLLEYGFLVGVSIDGPAARNAARIDWAGRETFSRTMRGIKRLHEAGIDITAICVVTTETVDRADELIDFFSSLGVSSVGFNLEEREGANSSREIISPEKAEKFWLRLWQLQEQGSQLPVRELDRVRDWLFARRAGDMVYGTDLAGPLPTVGFNGDVVLLSPELLGIQDNAHADFKVGNVLQSPLHEIVAEGMRNASYVLDFHLGLEACANTCDFWDFCRGAHAGNRFFENGHFDSTETAHCRNTKQSLIRATLSHLCPETEVKT